MFIALTDTRTRECILVNPSAVAMVAPVVGGGSALRLVTSESVGVVESPGDVARLRGAMPPGERKP